MTTVLSDAIRAQLDVGLAASDEFLETAYPGDDASRQPVHTVYVPADRFTEALPGQWGADAMASVDAVGGMDALAERVGVPSALVEVVSSRVLAKLAHEPIEDLRLDFEDGYGDRGGAEDVDAIRAAQLVAAAVSSGSAPPFIGIRFKCLERATRARALRTLDLFVGTLVDAGGLPEGLRLTLPKVSTVAQVTAMAAVVAALESGYGLRAGRLRFEVQVETPQLVLDATGRSPVAQLALAAPGRVSALHYGTYDYSASLGIAGAYQSIEHPVADFAKEVMQLAVAGTGIRLSDGSLNVLPLGDHMVEGWVLHARLVRRSLERGFFQGWDLHANQLPTRFLATYAFYREAYAETAQRLRAYQEQRVGQVLDEPATARALAWFVSRGVQCGAIDATEVSADIGITAQQLQLLAYPRRTVARTFG